jgi:DmsE family decaheme c-type cytochrome
MWKGDTMKFLRYAGILLALSGAIGFATTAHAAREQDPKAKDLILKGDAKCTGCHDEADEPLPTMLDLHPGVLRIGKTKHGTQADGRTPTCTNCHGESLDHLNYKGKDKPPKPDRVFTKGTTTPASQRNEGCLSCHQKDSARHLWAGSSHELRDVACTDCHQMHTQNDKVRNKRSQAEVCFTCHKEQRTQVNKPSHHPVLEGKVVCSDCHNVHGSAGPKLVKRDTVNDTCYQCHMEKRGPFVHSHEPVSEDCSNCHNPHGTTSESLLKMRPPMLCHQCHTPHGGNVLQLTGNSNLTASSSGKNGVLYTQARGCLNCHTQVHGSNNPSATNPTPQFNFR